MIASERRADAADDEGAPLRGQYRLSRRAADPVPDGFERETIGEWNVVFDAAFSAVPVAAGGDRVGLVVGTPVAVETGGPDAEIRPGEDRRPGSLAEVVRRTAFRLVGRYVGLIRGGEGVAVFTDPAGALPAVYEAGRGPVAASPLSLPSVRHGDRFRRELFEQVRRPRESWLPGTLTYYEGVRRLLPNHYLNLATGDVHRYWPTGPGDVSPGSAPQRPVDRIGDRLHDVFDAIVRRYDSPAMALTAGKDSRALLAAARRWARGGELSLYTYDDDAYAVDVHIARRIAATADLDWRPIPVVTATDEERDRFTRRTGYAVSSDVVDNHPTLQRLGADARIEGLGGEIGRGYYWRRSDDADTVLDGADLLDRFHKPRHPELVDDLDRWLAEVDAYDPPTVLDLAYQEHRLGCWAGPQHLGLPADIHYVCPFFYRPIIESMHRVPVEVRAADRLPDLLVDRAWEELNRLPYNAYTGLRRWRNAWKHRHLLRTAVTDPGKVARIVSRKYAT